MRKRQIVILGAGGFAREIHWLIRDINRTEEKYRFLGYVISDLARIGSHDARGEIVGDYSWLDANRGSIDAVAIGIGSPSLRLKVWREVCALLPCAELPPLIHPSAILDDASLTLGPGVQICAGTIVSVNVRLDALALCNFQCTIGHEAVVGECSVIFPGSSISGGVVLGKGVVVGAGVRILQYCRVGDGATVGVGSVVVCDVDAGSTVFGVPARPMSGSSRREAIPEEQSALLSRH